MVSSKAYLVIGITLVVVILFNLAIYAMAKRRGSNSINQFEMFSRAYKRARNPWEKDKAKQEELSKLLSSLQNSENQKKQGEEG